ncbi:hypothetical protein EGR_10286 [Echinococcus granulosus]|uniref:Uncharacterized protein n=1 Tax=Echinococcus granulosus TaxID=6210 RepID=W6U1C5_ECHGR|nr:hypothetical protein EGR_10286 [Echinococcus granulosus]EUB54843.1 hypothetical protein EGR_10286 [Echinococcus granulosus]
MSYFQVLVERATSLIFMLMSVFFNASVSRCKDKESLFLSADPHYFSKVLSTRI